MVAAMGCAADAPSAGVSDEEALDLLESVRAADYATWYAPRPDGTTPARSAAPHGEISVVYVSPELAAVAMAMLGPDDEPPEVWPAGSIAVSIGSTSDAPVDVSLLQIARRDEHGWTWAQYDHRDRVLAYGRPGTCIGCHQSGNDFIFSVPFPEPEESEPGG